MFFVKSHIGGGHDFMPLNHTSFQDLLVMQISHKLVVNILFTFQRKWS